MNRYLVIGICILLVLNITGTSFLIAENNRFTNQHVREDGITDVQLAQVNKIFDVVTKFQAELENVAGRASYPTDEKKSSANKYLQDHEMAFERARIEYLRVRDERTSSSAIRFLEACWGGSFLFGPTAVVEIDKYPFADYDNSSETYRPYPNVSFTKLESLDNEFRVLAISLIKDIK